MDRAIAQPVRPVTRQQFVRNHTQSINVGLRRDGLTRHLLRTRIFRRQQMHAGTGHQNALIARRLNQLRNAEVQKFQFAIRIHQNITWFQIAVNHLVLVQIVHHIA